MAQVEQKKEKTREIIFGGQNERAWTFRFMKTSFFVICVFLKDRKDFVQQKESHVKTEN